MQGPKSGIIRRTRLSEKIQCLTHESVCKLYIHLKFSFLRLHILYIYHSMHLGVTISLHMSMVSVDALADML